MCFYNINGVVLEIHPRGDIIIKTSVQDDNEGIEIRQYFLKEIPVKPLDISYYSRILVRGFHKSVII